MLIIVADRMEFLLAQKSNVLRLQFRVFFRTMFPLVKKNDFVVFIRAVLIYFYFRVQVRCVPTSFRFRWATIALLDFRLVQCIDCNDCSEIILIVKEQVVKSFKCLHLIYC